MKNKDSKGNLTYEELLKENEKLKEKIKKGLKRNKELRKEKQKILNSL